MSIPGSELRRFRSLVADLDAIVWEADAKSCRFTFVSEGALEILGYPPRRWVENPSFWADHIHPEDREAAVGEFIRATTDGRPHDLEYRMLAADGSTVWLRDLGHVVKDPEGTPLVVRGLMVEITAQKAVAAKHLEAEARYRALVEHLPTIVYIEAISSSDDAEPGGLLYVSPQVEQVLGFPAEEWLADPQAWARQFHPDDLGRIKAEYERIAASGGPFSTQYRMITRDGRVVWVHDDAVLIRDAEGEPLFWQGVMSDITVQKEAEEAAGEAEGRYRRLVEQLPAIVYLEAAEKGSQALFYISPQVEAILGISQAAWLADPTTWRRSIHPDDLERVEREAERAEREGVPYTAEYRMIAADGHVVWFRDEASVVLDERGNPRYWHGVMLDITERKRAEEQVQLAEARFRALVESTPAVSYVESASPEGGGTAYISPQVEQIFGYTLDEWTSTPGFWRTLVHPDDRERVLAVSDAADASGEPFEAQYRLVAKDGHEVWVHDRAFMLEEPTGERRWHGVFLDITERRRAEELEQALAVERETGQRLRQLDEMKNTFLQAVSHDFRTPLAAILGLAVTLERGDLDLSADESRDMATRIATNARKLDRLVTDLLDLDRLARGIVEPKLAETDVGELVRGMVEESDYLGERTLTLDVEPVVAGVDASKVERIVENLIANTARHTPARANVWVRVAGEDGGVLITVEDDGPGVPPENREAIFEHFWQGGGESSHSPGVGIGLALVRRFAELHGGRAWVQEREGGGASFRVFLASGDPGPAAAQPTGTGSASSAISPESQE